MGKKKKPELALLGKLRTHVAGEQYYEDATEAGEEIFFERNPENEYDVNAVEVRNKRHKSVGHLGREYSAFLAPLIDRGFVFLKGAALAKEQVHHTPIEVDVYLTKKGLRILKPQERDDPKQLLHNQVADFFNRCDKYSPDTIAGVMRQYELLVQGDVLPETVLLSRLLKGKMASTRQNERERCHQLVLNELEKVQIGSLLSYENLDILPLHIGNGHPMPYVLLGDAIKLGEAVVTEVSEGGSVPQLKVENKSEHMILILSGEELVGAKQNRIVNITIVVNAHSETVIPVSCVEQGRWDYRSRHFSAGRRAFASLRRETTRSVRRNARTTGRYDSDQSEVWAEVAACHSAFSVESPTGAMDDSYERMTEKLKGFVGKMEYPNGASGLAVFINGELVGVEFFEHPEILKKVWESEVESYAIDAMRMRKKRKAKVPAEGQINQCWEAIRTGLTNPRESVGAGYDIGIETEGLVGSAVVKDGKVVHLQAFVGAFGEEEDEKDLKVY